MKRANLKTIATAETDQALLQQYQKDGDQNKLVILFDRYLDMIYGVCLKYLKNAPDAQDAAMGIYEDLIAKARRYEIDNFKGWLYRFAVNFCLMKLRKDKKTPGIVDINEVFVQSEENFHHIDNENEAEMQLMENCLQTLPESQKQAVQLFYYQQKCYKEIAEMTRETVDKIRSFIQNGRRNLRICMEKQRKAEI